MADPTPDNAPLPRKDGPTTLGIDADALAGSDVTLKVGGKGEKPDVTLEIEQASGRKHTVAVPEEFIDLEKGHVRVKELVAWLGIEPAALVDALAEAVPDRAAFVDRAGAARGLDIERDAPVGATPVELHRSRRSGWSMRVSDLWSGMHTLPLTASGRDGDEVGAVPGSVESEGAGAAGFVSTEAAMPVELEEENLGCLSMLLNKWVIGPGLAAGALVLILIFVLSGGDDDGDSSGAGRDQTGGGGTELLTTEQIEDALARIVDQQTGQFDLRYTYTNDGSIPGSDGEEELEGEGWYDTSIPAWGATVDFEQLFAVGGGLPPGTGTTVDVRWQDDLYTVSGDAIALITGGAAGFQAASADEMLDSEVGAFFLPVLQSHPFGMFSQLGAVRYADDETTGLLRLSDAYGVDPLIDGAPARDVVHDLHVAQFGLDPDPALEDLQVSIGVRFESDELVSISQFVEFADVVDLAEDQIPDPQAARGSAATFELNLRQVGEPLGELPPVPEAISLSEIVVPA